VFCTVAEAVGLFLKIPCRFWLIEWSNPFNVRHPQSGVTARHGRYVPSLASQYGQIKLEAGNAPGVNEAILDYDSMCKLKNKFKKLGLQLAISGS